MNALRLTTLSLALAATLALVACGSLQIVGHVVVAGTEIGNGSAVEEPPLELADCDMSDGSCGATPPPPPLELANCDMSDYSCGATPPPPPVEIDRLV